MPSQARLFTSPTVIKLASASALVVLASACTPAPAPVSQSPRDPSSPTAPEGVTTTASTVPGSAATASEHEHRGHEHAAAAPGIVANDSTASTDAGAVVYVCPMHPEVTSPAPGICPKCNMKLVPKK
ncbi:MAG TPA: heavy metal-binding domain-containing protein [Labilithrix sp.]|jgi:hypothetical protein|nr:heavy metal-binding domain-containing protein [Labilithrix sp.]